MLQTSLERKLLQCLYSLPVYFLESQSCPLKRDWSVAVMVRVVSEPPSRWWQHTDDPSSEIITSVELEAILLFLFLSVSTWRDERIQCLKTMLCFSSRSLQSLSSKSSWKMSQMPTDLYSSAGMVRVSICFKKFKVLKEEGRYLQLNEEKFNFGQHVKQIDLQWRNYEYSDWLTCF